MKKILLVCLPFLLVSMITCSTCKSCETGCNIIKTTVKEIPYVIIMCDVTRSATPSELQIISDKAFELVKSLPNDAHYAVYPIEGNFFSEALLEHTKGFGKMPPSAIAKAKTTLADSLKVLIKTYYEKNKIESSCILNSFESAFKKFPESKDSSKYNCHLVYISDMLEMCDGRNLEVASKFEDSYKAMKANYKPTISYDKKKVALDIVVVAKNLPIDHTKYELFWKDALQKIGISNYNIDTTLPDASVW